MRAAAILACALLFLTIVPGWGGPGPPPRFFGVKSTALSADAKYLAVGLFDTGEEATAGRANLVLVYGVKDGKQLWAFAGHKQEVHHVAFTPDGKHLISGGGDGAFRRYGCRLPGQVLRDRAGRRLQGLGPSAVPQEGM